MAYIERLHGYQSHFRRKHGREPTAAEIARGLGVEVARPDTIRKAIEAIGPEPSKAIGCTYKLKDRKEDYRRCVRTLQQLQS